MIKKHINLLMTWVQAQDRRTWATALITMCAVVYGILWIIPRPVTLSYASSRTCISWPTLLPGLQRTVGGDRFMLSTEGGLSAGNVPLLSTRTCITPIQAPKTGNTMVALAPFGGWLFQQRLRVTVSSPPSVHLNTDRPVPATRALQLNLSERDELFAYRIQAGSKAAPCAVDPKKAILSCDLAPLGLEQGKRYPIEIFRLFKTGSPSTAFKGSVTTLTATTVVDGSVKNGDIIYTKPTIITFKTDKPLRRVTAVLTQQSTLIDTKTSVNDKTITVTLASELPRDKGYTLKLANLEAQDGSSLVEPYIVNFQTSGGPKVTGVSVGTSGVATNARIAVTFDQQISSTQDISKLVSVSGVPAQIERSGNQITYILNGGLCVPFTLSITKGLLSNYDVPSTADWTYSSRTICHTTSVYGYSLRGRALLSYTFGTSGPVTMYVGAIHGNESSSSGLMRAWVDDLEADPSLYSGKRVVVVPSINPDGLAANTRTNSRGVNLNRNFPTDDWVEDINDTDGYHEGGGGALPLSEPEAQALANLTISLHPRLLLSFHAVGSLVTGDPGGYSAGYAARYASMVGYSDTTYSSGGGFDYDITGAYEDWASSKQGIPSMVIELGSYGYYSFSHHRSALRAMLN